MSTSPSASASGLPCSEVRISARSSRLATISSYHLRRMLERCLAVSFAQAGLDRFRGVRGAHLRHPCKLGPAGRIGHGKRRRADPGTVDVAVLTHKGGIFKAVAQGRAGRLRCTCGGSWCHGVLLEIFWFFGSNIGANQPRCTARKGTAAWLQTGGLRIGKASAP
jgi:hypothetical protein